MLNTFWTDWRWRSDSYMKRVVVPRTTVLTSLLICQSMVGSIECKYSTTCLPHYHRGGQIWNHGPTSRNSQFISLPITCSTNSTITSQFDVKCIIWNSFGATIPTILGVLRYLLLEQNPQLIVITETTFGNADLAGLLQISGFLAQIFMPPKAWFRGIWIIWRPSMILVEEHPCFHRCLHLLLQIPLGTSRRGHNCHSRTRHLTRAR